MWWTPKLRELGDVMMLVDPRCSNCVKHIEGNIRSILEPRRDIETIVVECTLPLDVETAVGLQILGDRAVADSDLELTILARLEGE